MKNNYHYPFRKAAKFAIVITCLIVVSVIVYSAYFAKSDSVTYQAPVENEVKKASFGDEKKLEAIRNRENIKRQQELIVQETYLIEEKARVEREKEEAIAKFDTDISDIELKLETVRSEKTSFQ